MNEHPIIERLESSKRDVGLIIDDVKEADKLVGPLSRHEGLKPVLNGIDTVIRDLTKLRDDIQKSSDTYMAIVRSNSLTRLTGKDGR